MAFKLKQKNTFTWPVKVNIPVDGGTYEAGTFDAEFKRLPRSEVEKLSAQVFNSEISGIEAVKQILVGWSGVVDEGVEVPYSESRRDELLEVAGVGVVLFRAFTEANNGAAQAKN